MRAKVAAWFLETAPESKIRLMQSLINRFCKEGMSFEHGYKLDGNHEYDACNLLHNLAAATQTQHSMMVLRSTLETYIDTDESKRNKLVKSYESILKEHKARRW